MALLVCLDCTTAYAVGLTRCPHCGSTEHVEQGEPMPKITVHGGPSNAAASFTGDWAPEPAMEPATGVPVVGEHRPELDLPLAVVAEPEQIEDETESSEPEEESSPGNSSSESSETSSTKPEPSKLSPRKRAPKTASRSAKAPTDSSTAPGTDGGPTAPTSDADQ